MFPWLHSRRNLTKVILKKKYEFWGKSSWFSTSSLTQKREKTVLRTWNNTTWIFNFLRKDSITNSCHSEKSREKLECTQSKWRPWKKIEIKWEIFQYTGLFWQQQKWRLKLVFITVENTKCSLVYLLLRHKTSDGDLDPVLLRP